MNQQKIAYISPSVIPSRSANSVHVVHQCAALAANGHDLTLYFKQGIKVTDSGELRGRIETRYGASLEGVELAPYSLKLGRGVNLGIALMALWHMYKCGFKGWRFSRNLYFSFLTALFWPSRLIYETHEVESGFRGKMQKIILSRRKVKTVVISRALKEILEEEVRPIKGRVAIQHDAAPAGIDPDTTTARAFLAEQWLEPAGFAADAKVCGYFGQLYAGRGKEIIRALADNLPEAVFMIFGGDPESVESARAENDLPNLVYAGFIPNQEARLAQQGCDILLMPYQHKVSIGPVGRDTARWMSPMKMFEYMAAGVPLVASDLPALKEVLSDGENALLATPDDPDAWVMAVRRLMEEPELARQLAEQAYGQYKAAYNWRTRGTAIMEFCTE